MEGGGEHDPFQVGNGEFAQLQRDYEEACEDRDAAEAEIELREQQANEQGQQHAAKGMFTKLQAGHGHMLTVRLRNPALTPEERSALLDDLERCLHNIRHCDNLQGRLHFNFVNIEVPLAHQGRDIVLYATLPRHYGRLLSEESYSKQLQDHLLSVAMQLQSCIPDSPAFLQFGNHRMELPPLNAGYAQFTSPATWQLREERRDFAD